MHHPILEKSSAQERVGKFPALIEAVTTSIRAKGSPAFAIPLEKRRNVTNRASLLPKGAEYALMGVAFTLFRATLMYSSNRPMKEQK